MTEATATPSRTRRVAKGFGVFVLVALPSLFLVLLSADAPLVVGSDVFFISLAQVVFIAIFVVYLRRRPSGEPS